MTSFAAIHVGLKQLGLDEDAARDFYAQATGKRSLRQMTEAERRALLRVMRERGFQAAPSARAKVEGRFAPLLRALWLSAWNLGIVRSKADTALIAFVARQTQIDHPRWLRDAEDAQKAIEALKGWMRRETGDAELFTQDRRRASWENDPRVQVVRTQWRLLAQAGRAPATCLEQWRPGITREFAHGDGARLVEIQVALGHLIRGGRRP